MNALELITKLHAQIELLGAIPEIVIPGDHQMLYKLQGVEVGYIEDMDEYMMDEVHVDDLKDHIEDGGFPTKVLVLFG